jgi:5-methylcytosine-specific restriction endonuclease McrA
MEGPLEVGIGSKYEVPSMSDVQPATAIQGRENAWQQEDRKKILHKWELLVRLRGNSKRIAKEYLAERDGRRCQLCKMMVQDIHRELELDHIDADQRNNRWWNLRLAHHSCNSAAYRFQRQPAPSMPDRERGKIDSVRGEKDGIPEGEVSDFYPGYSSTPWSNREGEKHDLMRARWNAWIGDLTNGPFHGVGGVVRLRDLAEMAPRALGMGSSQSYRRYINEDRFGPLEVFRDDGILFVRYRGLSNVLNSSTRRT